MSAGITSFDVSEKPPADWDEFVHRCSGGIFAESAWAGVLSAGFGCPVIFLSLVAEGERRVACFGMLFRFPGFRILYAGLPYSSLIGEAAWMGEFVDGLESWARKAGVYEIRFPHLEPHDWLPPRGWSSSEHLRTALGLSGETGESLLAGYPRYVRRDVRRAWREGVRAVEQNGCQGADLFFHLYALAMKRNRTATRYPMRYFQALAEGPGSSGAARFVFGYIDEKPVAGAVLVRSGETEHYLHAGSDPAFLRSLPNEAIVHHLLEKAAASGIRRFDFGPSDPEDAGLIKFKEKWGGSSKVVQSFVWTFSPWRSSIFEWLKRVRFSKMMTSALDRER